VPPDGFFVEPLLAAMAGAGASSPRRTALPEHSPATSKPPTSLAGRR